MQRVDECGEGVGVRTRLTLWRVRSGGTGQARAWMNPNPFPHFLQV